MTVPVYSSEQFQSAALKTLPRGRAWPRSLGSTLVKVLGTLMPQAARFGVAAQGIVVDTFPGSTTAILAEWQKTLGLPDPCLGLDPTIELQRAQVVARLGDSGGSSIAYYIAFAKALGTPITITEFAPSRFGKKFGSTFGGDAWAYAWRVEIPSLPIAYRKFGDVFGEPFATWGSSAAQCEILQRKPAHTVLIFAYGGDAPSAPLGSLILGVNSTGAIA